MTLSLAVGLFSRLLSYRRHENPLSLRDRNLIVSHNVLVIDIYSQPDFLKLAPMCCRKMKKTYTVIELIITTKSIINDMHKNAIYLIVSLITK